MSCAANEKPASMSKTNRPHLLHFEPCSLLLTSSANSWIVFIWTLSAPSARRNSVVMVISFYVQSAPVSVAADATDIFVDLFTVGNPVERKLSDSDRPDVPGVLGRIYFMDCRLWEFVPV
jgi:hypothetical protein